MRSHRGFGLLEAIVALTLISSVGFVLMAWIQQNLDTTQRMREHYQKQEARRVILDWSSTLNPMQQPEGEITLGKMRLAWKSEQQGNRTTQSGYPAGTGLYDLALFTVHVSAYRQQDKTPWIEEEMTRTGYYKARSNQGLFQ